MVKMDALDIEIEVTKILTELGMPCNNMGYKYIKKAILIAVEDTDAVNAVTKVLYPQIAEEYKSSWKAVERCIREGVRAVWNKDNLEILQKYFGCTANNIERRPTSSKFIAMMVNYIINSYNEKLVNHPVSEDDVRKHYLDMFLSREFPDYMDALRSVRNK